MNKSKWFYLFNRDEGGDFLELERDIPDNPTHDELDTIAQELLSDYGYTADDDYVCIGKGKLVTIEMLGGELGEDIIEMLENAATDLCDCEEFFSGVSNSAIEDLDRRIAQVLKEWEEEHNTMSSYYTIPDTECFYYHGDNFNKEEQI